MTSPARTANQKMLGLAYLGALWLWAASSCWREWSQQDDYNYGWIVFPLSGYFAWKSLAQNPPEGTRVPLFERIALIGVFLPVLLALPFELIRLAPLYWNASSWLIFFTAAVGTFSLSYLLGGGSWLVAAFFPLLLASTAIPWPTFAENSISLHLTEWTASIVNEWLHLWGAPSRREGLVIFLPDCAIGIERACSGLRSLQASIMTGLVAGELFALRPWRRVVLLLLCPYLALLANLVRTFVIATIGFRGGEKMAAIWHDPSDWFALIGMMGVILFLAFLFRGRDRRSLPSIAPTISGPGPARAIALAGLAFIFFIGLAHAWYWLHETNSSDLPLLEIGRERPMEKFSLLPVPSEILGELAPSRGYYFRLESLAFGPVSGYHFFWKRSRNAVEELYHRPDVCMPGAGWVLMKPPVTWPLSLHGKMLEWHLFEYQRNGTQVDLLWGAWLGGRSLRYFPQGSASLQTQLLWQLIFAGIRDTNYEVAAVLVAHSDKPLTPAAAAEILNLSFSIYADSAHR